MKHVLHLWFIFIIQLFLISNETFDQNHHNDDLNLHQMNIITINNVLVKYNENCQIWKVDCDYDYFDSLTVKNIFRTFLDPDFFHKLSLTLFCVHFPLFFLWTTPNSCLFFSSFVEKGFKKKGLKGTHNYHSQNNEIEQSNWKILNWKLLK